jgi:ribonuclease HI
MSGQPSAEPCAVASEQNPIAAYVDGGYTPNERKGVWCFIVDGMNPSFGFVEDPDSKLSNNIMEYRAIIELLKSVADGANLSINSDSQLVVNQLLKIYRVNYDHLAELNEEVWDIVDQKNLHVSFTWINREINKAGIFIERNQKSWFGRKFRERHVRRF